VGGVCLQNVNSYSTAYRHTLQRDWSSATGRSVRPVGCSVHTLRQSDEIKHPTVCPTVCPTVGRSVYTMRSSDRPVGQTSRTDRSVRRSERVNAQLDVIVRF